MLARAHRITSGDDYRHVVRRGARYGVRGLTVSLVEASDTNAPTRFGFIISKRVGVAVVRNRLRRRLKAISLELLADYPHGADIVYRVQPEAAEWSFAELREHARVAVAGAARKANRAGRHAQGSRLASRATPVRIAEDGSAS